MITQGETIPEYGEYVEKMFKLIQDVTFDYNNRAIVYNDPDNHPRIRVYMRDQQLCYDYDNGLGWTQGGILTPAGSNIGVFPQLGSAYIRIEDGMFEVVQNNQQQVALVQDTITLNSKHVVGIVPSSDPTSAVNLQQLLGVVQGETTDVIISMDLATRVKCESNHLQVKVNTYEAFGVYKPSQQVTRLQLSPGASGLELITQENAEHCLKIQGGSAAGVVLHPTQPSNSQLKILYLNDTLTIQENADPLLVLSKLGARYGFNSLTQPLSADDLIDMKTADSRYTRQTAQGNLDMNGNKVVNAAPATNSNDLVTLGQLSQNQYIYMYTTNDVPVTNQQYIDVQFDDAIEPTVLIPAVQRSIEAVTLLGNQAIQMRPGVYKVCLHTVMTYSRGTQTPVRVELVGSIIGTVVQSQMQTSNVDSYMRPVHCERSFIMRVNLIQTFQLRIYTLDSFASAVKAGTSISIEQLQ